MSEREIIPYICSEDLDSATLDLVCSNEEIDLYWTDDWSVQLYCGLAEAGFISTSFFHEELGELLLPEIQHEYAVLDWENLHISRNVRRVIKSSLVDEGFYLTVSTDLAEVVNGIESSHLENWLTPQYHALLTQIIQTESVLKPIAVEMRHGRSNRLVAGEVGYIIGAVYTSLSGFTLRDSELKSAGTIQLILLAKLLEMHRFRFWNLGHPHMDYKRALGAEIVCRRDFLKRWYSAVNDNGNYEDLLRAKLSASTLMKNLF